LIRGEIFQYCHGFLTVINIAFKTVGTFVALLHFLKLFLNGVTHKTVSIVPNCIKTHERLK